MHLAYMLKRSLEIKLHTFPNDRVERTSQTCITVPQLFASKVRATSTCSSQVLKEARTDNISAALCTLLQSK